MYYVEHFYCCDFDETNHVYLFTTYLKGLKG